MVFLELRRDSRVTTGNSGCLLCWPREVQSSIRVAKESWGLLSSDCRANRPHLGLCPEASVPLQGRLGRQGSVTQRSHLVAVLLNCRQGERPEQIRKALKTGHPSHRHREQGFLGGSVIKIPPANGGDMGLIPGPGRSHMPRATDPVHGSY